MDGYIIILCAVVFLSLFSGLGFAILSLIYTWLKLKLEEISDKVGH